MPGCLPHARGGVSPSPPLWPCPARSSPRSWGCFFAERGICVADWVFPTLVGVFLGQPLPGIERLRLPHARGGVSQSASLFSRATSSSPRSWGCFSSTPVCPGTGQVFPTLVGVFPDGAASDTIWRSLPHARGGVSFGGFFMAYRRRSSPRSWGCFRSRRNAGGYAQVFPTLVGVFPKGDSL